MGGEGPQNRFFTLYNLSSTLILKARLVPKVAFLAYRPGQTRVEKNPMSSKSKFCVR